MDLPAALFLAAIFLIAVLCITWGVIQSIRLGQASDDASDEIAHGDVPHFPWGTGDPAVDGRPFFAETLQIHDRSNAR